MGLFDVVKDVAGDVGKAVSKTVEKAGKTALKTAVKEAKKVGKGALGDAVNEVLKLGKLNPAIATQLALGKSIANGESLIQAAEAAVKAGVKSTKEGLKYAEIVAPFVPGIGSGAAAALAAGGALANGRSITDAAISAARSAIPGGAAAGEAFDVGLQVAQGADVTATALELAREELPADTNVRKAFDAAVALGHGQKLQKKLKKAGKRRGAPSAFAADPKEFIRAVKADTNIQSAALSPKGRAIFQRSKRAAEVNGRRRNTQRIDALVRKGQHGVRVPKSVRVKAKKAKQAAIARHRRRKPAAGPPRRPQARPRPQRRPRRPQRRAA